MKNKGAQKRNFKGMSYREVQQSNSRHRSNLSKEDQKWLKNNSYKNVGWEKVIQLHQKIEEFREKNRLENLTLEELFLEADKVGNKYLSSKDLEEFNQNLTEELSEIEKEIDKQFVDTEIETVDYSNQAARKKNQKTYRATRN